MSDSSSDRRKQFRAAIEHFLHERRDAKLEKMQAEDPKRDALIAQFSWDAWIDDAARRVGQIQAVTHSLKAVHPDARGTNLYRPPTELPQRAELGSHALENGFAGDVVGNAAALDVYKFLRIEVDGQSLLDWILVGDQDLAAELSDDPQQSSRWIEAFAGLVRSRSGIASHTRAKQVYWLVGNDPCQDDHFHLLAPLYATSLAHAVFAAINEDRFGESAKEARHARREKRDFETGYAEYPDLAVQKLGGTKPQNISQLNSERGGSNYLLGSLPPRWISRAGREPWFMDSIFPHFGRRQPVREAVKSLSRFLSDNPDPTMETRARRDALIDAVIDELVCFARELGELSAPGWSADQRCELVDAEQLWLDPGRAESDDVFRARWLAMDWPKEIGQRFGNWLNGQLGDRLPVGDIEQRHWSRELLVDSDWAAWLDSQRRRVSAIESAAEGASL